MPVISLPVIRLLHNFRTQAEPKFIQYCTTVSLLTLKHSARRCRPLIAIISGRGPSIQGAEQEMNIRGVEGSGVSASHTMSAVEIADEETPFLQGNTPTPLPWSQFSLVLVLQLAEPLTSNVIYPFAPQVCPTMLNPQLLHEFFAAHSRHWHNPWK